jgi:hypothetical protein
MDSDIQTAQKISLGVAAAAGGGAAGLYAGGAYAASSVASGANVAVALGEGATLGGTVAVNAGYALGRPFGRDVADIGSFGAIYLVPFGNIRCPSSARSTVPSGGRLGSPNTRAQVAEIQAELKARRWTVTHGGTLGEEYIPGPGGARVGSAFPDITATKNGRTLRINTTDTLSDAVTPTAREATNAAKIRRLKPNEHLLLVPKQKP